MGYATLREKISAEKAARATRNEGFARLYADAWAAGQAAVIATIPTPMNVIDQARGIVYHVPDGACGFAWVNVLGGNSAFARWLVKNGYARKSYDGGVDIWISAYNQSIDRKAAHAGAMAKVFRAAGIPAYAFDRLD